MSVKFYATLWAIIGAVTLGLLVTGNLTTLMLVAVGFICFGMVFMGMINVLPLWATHQPSTPKAAPPAAEQPVKSAVKDEKRVFQPSHFATR